MKPRAQIANMTTRQKVTAAFFILILLFLVYQIYEMMGGRTTSAPTPPPKATAAPPMSAAGPVASPPMPAPQTVAPPPKPPVISQRELELMKMQQEAEDKYIATLNELQMLKLEQQIAETTRAIMSAKLETVTAQKGIVDLLKPPAPVTPTGYAQGLVTPIPSGTSIQAAPPTQPTIIQAPPTQISPPTQPEVTYSVISVSQLQNKWNAVLGFQGNLYNVNIGDFLPPDQSKVISIDRSGVVLERNGIKRKISLVPII